MEKLKILLVDDDEDDRQFFADALDSLDMNTELVQLTDGEACLEYMNLYKNDGPNLLFLDLNMPIMNGFQCLERIRQQAEFNDVTIAIYSTSGAEKDIDETFNKGANIYLKKPASFQDLKNSLRQVIKTNWTYQKNDFSKENFLLKV
ncbi:response regulator [Costertonia aggregata]|nr:response regulator [Costertonia aggregata]